jgi:hypothetical protein
MITVNSRKERIIVNHAVEQHIESTHAVLMAIVMSNYQLHATNFMIASLAIAIAFFQL